MRFSNIEFFCKGKIKKIESYKLKINLVINVLYYKIMFGRLRGEFLFVC